MSEVLDWIGGSFAAVLGIIAGLFSFGGGETVFYGYVEADYVYVAPASAGTIEAVMVAPGETVAAGTPLFRLDARTQQAALASVQAQAAAARAELENAKTGQRPEELAITERSLERARSDLELAQQNYSRTSQLFEQAVVPRARLDQDHASLMAAQAQVEQLEAQLTVGRLPARPAVLAAARAAVEAAAAQVAQLEVALTDRTGRAPSPGVVDDVFFAAGEQAGPSIPVVSILPRGGLEIRFFVAESDRPSLSRGTRLSVTCRGCGEPVVAAVTWQASDAQFNPPIIYSRQARDELVFLVKARPEGDVSLAPGQPVEVRPLP